MFFVLFISPFLCKPQRKLLHFPQNKLKIEFSNIVNKEGINVATDRTCYPSNSELKVHDSSCSYGVTTCYLNSSHFVQTFRMRTEEFQASKLRIGFGEIPCGKNPVFRAD